ncbi:TIGR03086 family protein [Rhodococcus wratislaviensis]|nr:TIGR03086 family protein [Rhodococcus sp. 3A]MBC2891411.1 TIGR03086 family protein [Rhodococcus sp. 4CII]
MDVDEIRRWDARAVEASRGVVSRVTRGDLQRPTPCAQWNLGQLLAHMTVQHRGFAAAAAGSGPDLANWQPRVSTNPVAAYVSAADAVVEAFARGGVGERRFWLPEISTEFPFPAATAIGFHFLDYAVHSWDVARSIGLDFAPESDVVAAVLPIARLVPDGSDRLRDGAAFAPGVPAEGNAADFGAVLSLLGRSQGWRPAYAPGRVLRRDAGLLPRPSAPVGVGRLRRLSDESLELDGAWRSERSSTHQGRGSRGQGQGRPSDL